MKIENLDEILEKSFSLNDLARCFFNKSNYTNREKSKKILQENNINWQEWLNSKKRKPNFCLFCGREITGRYRYIKKFCNSSCSASYNNHIRKRKEVKYCLNCGKEIEMGRKKTSFCDNKCQREYEYRTYIEKWRNGNLEYKIGSVLSRHIKRYMLEKNDYSCEECGCNWVNPKSNKTILEIHHIDGNAFNNKEENLKVLCPNCHAMTDNYKNNNKMGRTKRLKEIDL